MESEPTEQMATDSLFMKRCLQLARHGEAQCSPNPMVGAVLVKEGRVIGEGWHQQAGLPHAEPNAISHVKDPADLKKATLYVNLEPCSHYGKTPPCVDLIINKRIPRVVVGTPDVFPLVSGRGISRLRSAGIEVKVGVEEVACRELNRSFFTFHALKRPYIILKWAMTEDGFIDHVRKPGTVERPFIVSTPLTSMLVHRLRSMCDVILVGTRTAWLDNPQLNVRHWEGRSPVRAVIDRRLDIPLSHHIFDGTVPTLVFTEKKVNWTIPNVAFITLEEGEAVIPQILTVLYRMNKLVLLVEGGTQLLESFLAAGLWDEIQVEQSPVYLRKGVPAPCLIGLNGLLMTEKVVGEGDQHRIIRSFRSESSLQLTGLFPQLRGSARI